MLEGKIKQKDFLRRKTRTFQYHFSTETKLVLDIVSYSPFLPKPNLLRILESIDITRNLSGKFILFNALSPDNSRPLLCNVCLVMVKLNTIFINVISVIERLKNSIYVYEKRFFCSFTEGVDSRTSSHILNCFLA